MYNILTYAQRERFKVSYSEMVHTLYLFATNIKKKDEDAEERKNIRSFGFWVL